MNSLFEFMRDQGWTTFAIMQDREKGEITMRAAMEWLPAVNWANYGSEDLSSTMEWYETKAVVRSLADSPVKEHFDRIVALMKHGRHQRLELLLDWKDDIRFVAGIHSTKLGHPAGGIRRHPLDDSEIDVIADILNLSRGMSFKNAAASIPNGGCKFGVHSSLPEEERNDRFYGFLAFCIDRNIAFTGPDMGFSLEDANRIRKFTKNIVGGTSETGSGGATGVTAAWGVFVAIQQALAEAGIEKLEGASVAVQGVGELGRPLVEHLLGAGARVLAADTSDEALASLPEAVTRGSAGSVLRTQCDVLAPCAVGGILDEQVIDELRCKLILGGANNQLHASSEMDEYLMAKRIADRGILFVPDWIVNAGGVIQGKMEHVKGQDFVLDEALKEAEGTISQNVKHVLAIARREGITPTEAAYRKFNYTVYGSID
jgi:glutamate dehydrogenase/leucine dehydrogenase